MTTSNSMQYTMEKVNSKKNYEKDSFTTGVDIKDKDVHRDDKI